MSSMIDFKTIETFLWVANLRSFRGAAEKLNTTQPAVSMRIAQLEDLLGVRLLDRDRRIVAPTPKGQVMLVYAERLMRLHAEMIEAVGDRSTMRGIVRLGCSETIVHTWLPKLIERVNTAYPNLELEIEVDITPNLRARLTARDLDLAMLLGPISDPNIHSRPLCTFPLAFVAGNKVKLPSKAVALETIAQWPIVTFSRNTHPYIVVREMFVRAGLQVTIHASASLATVVRMALDGIGIAVIPPAILDNVAAPGKLRLIKTSVKLPSLNFVVAWPSSPDSFAAQKVAEIATQVARENKQG
jgi:DNA-binding transcriptional LysR family regulator